MWLEHGTYAKEFGTYTAEGIIAIADALRVSEALTSIDVGVNNIGKEAALGLVAIFKEKDRMTSVGLAECDLGAEGAVAVADYVRVSEALTEIKCAAQNLAQPEPSPRPAPPAPPPP